MPTPFYHLALAESLLADRRLHPRQLELLTSHRGAFLFGNTAPDVQTLSGQDRAATHFFRIPMRDRTLAHETMLARYPELAAARSLAAEHAAFVAGYICHLLLDQLWIWEVFQPVFGLQAHWETLRERLFLHNVMRVYLDRQDLPDLPADVAARLARVRPCAWLPFAEDRHLRAWRDFLREQLVPGAASRTVEVFARRMGRDPAEFEALLGSREVLRSRLWTHIDAAALAEFRASALAKSRELLHIYLGSLT